MKWEALRGREGGSGLADLPSWADVYTEQALVRIRT